MTSKLKKFRAFFILLVFVLALAPMNIFASANKTEINYVSLGDSLAAGLLSDGKTISKGYAGYIKESLESNGYKVAFTNEGVPGFTSAEVYSGLQQIEKLNDADIVTVSAGANDLLKKIDLDVLKQFKPEYLDPSYVGNATTSIEQKLQTLFDDVQLLTQLGGQSLTAIERILNTTSFTEIKQNFNEAKQDIDNATTKFIQAKTAYDANEQTFYTLLEEALSKFEEGIKKLLSLEENIPDSSLIPGLAQELLTIKNIIYTKIKDAKETLNKLNELNTVQKIQQMLNDVQQEINYVGVNIGKIISYIKQINPDADIYVMGYYNALPYLPAELQQQTVPLIKGLNTAIKSATESSGATFVETYSVFEGKYQTYLPNPANIHPGEDGYQAIGKVFMNEILKVYPPVKESTENTPDKGNKVETNIKIELGQTVTVHKGQQVTIYGTKVKLVLPNDLPDGTVLTVTATDHGKLTKAKGLNAVGDVLDFHFEFPNGYENYKGTFMLIMGYDGDSDEVDIYYFDEQSQTWVQQNGKVDPKEKQVRLEVTHFSNYGVFAKESVQTGKKLPKTATNDYNWIFVGFLMIVLGMFVGKNQFRKLFQK